MMSFFGEDAKEGLGGFGGGAEAGTDGDGGVVVEVGWGSGEEGIDTWI